LSTFGIIPIDPQLRKWLYGTLIVSLGVIVIGFLTNAFKTPYVAQRDITSSEIRAGREAVLQKTQDNTVYIQIANNDQRKDAEILRQKLSSNGFFAPGIEYVDGRAPSKFQVRYLGEADSTKAAQVATIIKGAGLPEPTKVQLSIPGRTTGPLEVWFPSS
jgi:hypothetical protein